MQPKVIFAPVVTDTAALTATYIVGVVGEYTNISIIQMYSLFADI